ncbi:MAG TPA: sulfatase [Elusimicrobiota bacterium]|nr:sulfatase [Elusimicrobiota bacterium]
MPFIRRFLSLFLLTSLLFYVPGWDFNNLHPPYLKTALIACYGAFFILLTGWLLALASSITDRLVLRVRRSQPVADGASRADAYFWTVIALKISSDICSYGSSNLFRAEDYFYDLWLTIEIVALIWLVLLVLAGIVAKIVKRYRIPLNSLTTILTGAALYYIDLGLSWCHGNGALGHAFRGVLLVCVALAVAYYTHRFSLRRIGNASAGTSCRKWLPGVSLVILLASGADMIYENADTPTGPDGLRSHAPTDENVILITLDALRADHLGCYGYPKETSPRMDALAKSGVIFKHCYSQSAWTKTSVPSILSSLHLSEHQMDRLPSIPDNLPSLPKALRQAGWITYGYTASPVLTSDLMRRYGFDVYDDDLMRDRLYHFALRNLQPPILQPWIEFRGNDFHRRNIRRANRRIFSWLDKHHRENFFMYLHFTDTHRMYYSPRSYKKLFPVAPDDENDRISFYDSAIRFTDDQLGTLLDRLKSLGIYDKTLIVITADHGDAHGERYHFYEHGEHLYQSIITIPLIMKFPNDRFGGSSLEQAVQNIDIMPTVLDHLNIPHSGLSGASLIPGLDGRVSVPDREYLFFENIFMGKKAQKAVLWNNRWKFIVTDHARTHFSLHYRELYDLSNDPLELHNLAFKESVLASRMHERMDSFLEEAAIRRKQYFANPVPQDTTETIKTLTYLQ